MLINTQRLTEIAPKQPYGYASGVSPNGSGEMPVEFREKSVPYSFEQPYVFELDNVELAGPICVCFWNDDIVLDVAYFGRLDTWDRNRRYFNQAVESRRMFAPQRIERACSLLGVWSGNYFHWTLEILPLLEGIDKDTTLLVEHQPAPWVFESLKYLGYENIRPIESMYYQVDKLLVPTVRRRDGRTSPDSVDYLRRKTSKIGECDYRKIYIGRGDATKRQITNESEVVNFLRHEGFVPVTFTGLSWEKQVAIIKGAEAVVAPHGAGMVNLAYSHRQPAIIELATPEYLNPCFYTLAAAIKADYKLLVGDPEPGENISIDVTELERIL